MQASSVGRVIPAWLRNHIARFFLLLFSSGFATLLIAQDSNFSLEMRVDDERDYEPGETVQSTVGLVTQLDGVQGWSYGISHDRNLLRIDAVSTANDTTDLIVGAGAQAFVRNTIVENGGTDVGFIQAVVLSLDNIDVSVPASDFFAIARATYTVREQACGVLSIDRKALVAVVDDLAVGTSPPVVLNVTVDGAEVVPATASGEVSVVCKGVAAGLSLTFAQDDCDLVADQIDEVDLEISLNSSTATQVQAWSYGVELPADLEAVAIGAGAASQGLTGGAPDLYFFDLAATAPGGRVGVTVGAVVDDAGSETLTVDGSAHVDTLTLRSTRTIASGGSADSAMVSFTGDLSTAGRELVPVEAVVGSGAETPDSSSTKVVNLLPVPIVSGPLFIRGDANRDARVDISDGIWILATLFGGRVTECMPAADSNGSGNVDVTDAMHIFNWRLQPEPVPAGLHSAPSAPFPNCGTDPNVTEAECPAGSTTCS